MHASLELSYLHSEITLLPLYSNLVYACNSFCFEFVTNIAIIFFVRYLFYIYWLSEFLCFFKQFLLSI